MKTSDLKKKLKQTAISEMPDIINKINIDSIDIIPQNEPIKNIFWSFKRVMSYSFSLLFVTVIGLTAYSLLTNDTSTVLPLETEESLISFQAISSATLLDQIDTLPLSFDLLSNDSTVSLQDEISTVNDYLNMMEVVLGDSDSMVSVSQESDKPEYQYYILYRNIDLIGNLIEFKIYYNITTDALTSTLSGIMYHDDKEYEIGGFIDQETNNLSSFTVYLDDSKSVMVSDISDDKNQKFAYYQYENNELQNQGTVTLQLSNAVMKASIETSGTTANVNMNVMRVKVAESARLQVQYQISSNGVSSDGEFEVGVEYDQNSGMYQYMYYTTMGSSHAAFSASRGYKGNQKASDDDFTVTGSTTPITPKGNGSTHGGNTNSGNGQNNETTMPSNTEELITTIVESEIISI